LLNAPALGASYGTGGDVAPSTQTIDQTQEQPSTITEEKTPPTLDALTWGTLLIAIAIGGLVALLRAWWIPPDYGPSWPARPEVLIGTWVVLLLAGMAAGLLAHNFLQERSDLMQQGGAMVAIYLIDAVIIGAFLIYLSRQRHQVAREGTPRQIAPSKAVVWGVLGFLVAFPIAQSVGVVVGQLQNLFLGVAPDVLAHETLQSLRRSPGDPWAIVIMVLVVVAAPIVEEFSYRGLVQQSFRGLGANRSIAIVLTSLLFVFMHVPALPNASIAAAIATLLVLSLVLGWLYERTGRLLVPIIAHALFNAVNLALLEFLV